MLIDRRKGRPVRHLEWRIRLFGAGAIMAVVGIATEQSWLVNVAIAVLAVGVLLRFVGKPSETTTTTEDE
jgi:hypothetical protein